MLQDAHNEGDITVAGIYVEGAQLEGRALYVFLDQDDQQWEDVIRGPPDSDQDRYRPKLLHQARFRLYSEVPKWQKLDSNIVLLFKHPAPARWQRRPAAVARLGIFSPALAQGPGGHGGDPLRAVNI